MKKLLIFLLITVGLNAQFNYQAIVKDSDGNPVTNNLVNFKFSLMYQSSTATPVYVEEHELVTPPDGVVNLSVGGGTVVNGTFSNIDWSQSVFMKEELDYESGYQDMGTNRILAVPVAEFAKSLSGFESDEVLDNIKIGDGSLLSVTSASSNIAIGKSALSSNTTGNNNIAIGRESLKNINNSYGNIAIGSQSLLNNRKGTGNTSIGEFSMKNQIKAARNIAIGSSALAGKVESTQNIDGDFEPIDNIAIGVSSLENNSLGNQNIGIGYGSLFSNNEGDNNIGIGSLSLSANVSGTENIAIGRYSLSSNKADGNTAVGYTSMMGNQSGFHNTALGWNTLTSNDSGKENTSIGAHTMAVNTTGYANTAVGRVALHWNLDGNRNSAVGQGALFANTSGSENTAIGDSALQNVEEGYNVGVGRAAGIGIVSGTLNTAIGYRSDISNNLTNATAIGANATVTASNTIQLGNTDVTLVNTSGIVSASGFKGSGNEITLTDSGTIVTLLDKIAQLEDKIEQLETNQSTTSNTSTNSTSGNSSITFSSFTPTQEADSVILFAVFSDPDELYDSTDSSGGFYVEIWDDPSQKTVHELTSISGYQLTAEIDNLESSTKYYYRFGYETYSVQAESTTQSFNTKSVLGDEAYGGTIVELESNGLHGKVVAPSTFWILKQWSNVRCEAQDFEPNRDNGYTATYEIIEYFETVEASAPAAEYCWTLDIYGYNDWYLPLADEMYDALNELESKGKLSLEMKNTPVWSSRNNTSNESLCYAYYAYWNGNQNISSRNRDEEGYVMPMRNF